MSAATSSYLIVCLERGDRAGLLARGGSQIARWVRLELYPRFYREAGVLPGTRGDEPEAQALPAFVRHEVERAVDFLLAAHRSGRLAVAREGAAPAWSSLFRAAQNHLRPATLLLLHLHETEDAAEREAALLELRHRLGAWLGCSPGDDRTAFAAGQLLLTFTRLLERGRRDPEFPGPASRPGRYQEGYWRVALRNHDRDEGRRSSRTVPLEYEDGPGVPLSAPPALPAAWLSRESREVLRHMVREPGDVVWEVYAEDRPYEEAVPHDPGRDRRKELDACRQRVSRSLAALHTHRELGHCGGRDEPDAAALLERIGKKQRELERLVAALEQLLVSRDPEEQAAIAAALEPLRALVRAGTPAERQRVFDQAPPGSFERLADATRARLLNDVYLWA